MSTLTDEQAQRARELLESYRERAEKHERMYEQGKVAENLASFFSRLAGKYKKRGILLTHLDEVDKAQVAFESAAEKYLTSVNEHDPNLAVLSSLPIARGIYAAALAGDETLLHQFAETGVSLNETHQLDTDDPNADRFYLSGCLSNAVTGDVSLATIEGIEAVNTTKPDIDALYGQAIIEFTRGILAGDSGRLERGIESMCSYHDRQRDEENVLDLIMAPQATALSILARYRGFDVSIESEFIPLDLVDSSVEELQNGV